jgi:NDP-sugar pyrophosphorylase family protein
MLRHMAPRTALLMAAGRGTRLGAMTADIPKPLLEVAGEPLLAHILEGLIEAGLARFVVVTGYRGEQVEQWCLNFQAIHPSVTIRTVHQTNLNGTGGAMLTARRLLLDEESFIFGWGDILMDRDNYPRFTAELRRADCDLLLAVNEMEDPWRGGAVYFDSDLRVERIVEKPPRGTSSTRWNNAGLFATNRCLFDYVERLRPSPRGELELPQAIAAMIADGRVVRAFTLRGFWSDVGTPEDLETARAHFKP